MQSLTGRENFQAPNHGRLVLVGTPPEAIDAWRDRAQQSGVECAVAATLDECQAYAASDYPTLFVAGAVPFATQLADRQEDPFRRATVIVVCERDEELSYWRWVAWDALPLSASPVEIAEALTTSLSESNRRVSDWALVSEYHRRRETLSENEELVLQAICEGRLNKQIASDLRVSVRTIEQRRRRIFEKMGVGSVAPLAALIATAQTLEAAARRAHRQVARLCPTPPQQASSVPLAGLAPKLASPPLGGVAVSMDC